MFSKQIDDSEEEVKENVEGILRWVVANVLDCKILVSKFELQSRYYVYVRTNTFGKGKKLISLSCGLTNVATILLEGWFWH